MSKRIKFFLAHLAISVLIGLLVLLLVFLIWYPAPLAKALGVTDIFLMLLVIDVIIGPLLSLLVYKEGKKTLKMDLATIFILQIAALGYGLYNIEQGRPVWIAFQSHQFELIRRNEVQIINKQAIQSSYKDVPWLKPKLVSVNEGENLQDKNKMVELLMNTGFAAAYFPEYYQPVQKAKNNILANARDLSELEKFNASSKVDHIVNQYPSSHAWLPMRVMMGIDMVVLIDKEGGVLDIVDLRPWNLSTK